MSNKPVRPPQQSFSEIEPGSKSGAPSAGMKGIIDALLQGSLVDLFQAYGVAIAPLPRDVRAEPERYPELSALISFNVGIELAQLSVIAIAYFAVARWIEDKAWYRARFVIPVSAVIAATGLFWTVQRLFLT